MSCPLAPFSSGISLQIPAAEIRKLAFPSNQLFADCLELGAHFPSLKFACKPMKDFIPLWLDSSNEPASRRPKKPPKPAPPVDDASPEDTEAPPVAAQPPVALPLPPLLPSYTSSRGGGGGGR
jgi:hypothetical protein